MVNNIHLVTFAEGISVNTGKEYAVTQRLLNESIKNKTKYNIIFHNHNLETIKQKNWFEYIENFPKFNLNEHFPHSYQYKYWHRNGYFNAWKPFLIKEVYDSMADNDLLYYVDSSAYHQFGFEYDIDSLIDYAFENKHVCGSFGFDVLNNSYNCCDNESVWNFIWPESISNIKELLNKPHILNSWFLFAKSNESESFINEWNHLVKSEINNLPIVSYHHTVDQSIFNILVYKYGFKSFCNNRQHDENKNHNLVHFELNQKSKDEIVKSFINPLNFNVC